MTQRDNIDQLETTVQGMQWETMSMEPLQEDVQALDQELPAEWTERTTRFQSGRTASGTNMSDLKTVRSSIRSMTR